TTSFSPMGRGLGCGGLSARRDSAGEMRASLSFEPLIPWIPGRLRNDLRLAHLIEHQDFECLALSRELRRDIGEGERFVDGKPIAARRGDAGDPAVLIYRLIAARVVVRSIDFHIDELDSRASLFKSEACAPADDILLVGGA